MITGTLLVALTATACSTSSKASSNRSGTTTPTTVDTALLGPSKPATGAPLKVGYIYAGQTQTEDNEPEIKIAQATAKYVNDHLGGIAGHQIQLVTCADHLTPAGATDCANQMLAANVAVVLAGQPANPAPILKLLEPARVPFVNSTGADASVLFSADAVVLTNPLVILAAPIKVAHSAGVKKVAMVYVDVPAAAQLTSIGKPMFQKAGLDLLATAVPLGTPDVTPQVQAAISNGAQEFLIVGDISLCNTTLKALNTLGFQGKVLSNMNCLADPSASDIPGGFDGLIMPTTRIYNDSEPDYKLLQAIAATYSPGTPTNEEGQASLGFVMVMSLVRATKSLAASDATSAGIANAFLTMTPQPLPLLSTQTFRCNRKVSSLTPSVCSNGAAIETLDKSGNPTKTESFDATPYLAT